MQVALQRHHEWLAARGIHTVISPGERSERTYIFRFDTAYEARLFRKEVRRRTDQAARQLILARLLGTAAGCLFWTGRRPSGIRRHL